jgi:hypothetical protein
MIENIFTKEEVKLLLDNIPKWRLGKNYYPIFTRFGKNLRLFRKQLLDKRSPGELSLFSKCREINGAVIPQFPIMINNPISWAKCLKLVNLDNDKFYKNQSCFIVDILV